jgi:hypothetical protein
MANFRPKLGEILIELDLITEEELKSTLELQKTKKQKLGQLLIEQGIITETQLIQALSRQLSIPWISLKHVRLTPSLYNIIPQEVVEKEEIVPVYLKKTSEGKSVLYIATTDPTDRETIERLSKTAKMVIRPLIAGRKDIKEGIKRYSQLSEPLAEIKEKPLPSNSPLLELLNGTRLEFKSSPEKKKKELDKEGPKIPLRTFVMGTVKALIKKGILKEKDILDEVDALITSSGKD